jgi:hypothetical protein
MQGMPLAREEAGDAREKDLASLVPIQGIQLSKQDVHYWDFSLPLR